MQQEFKLKNDYSAHVSSCTKSNIAKVVLS